MYVRSLMFAILHYALIFSNTVSVHYKRYLCYLYACKITSGCCILLEVTSQVPWFPL